MSGRRTRRTPVARNEHQDELEGEPSNSNGRTETIQDNAGNGLGTDRGSTDDGVDTPPESLQERFERLKAEKEEAIMLQRVTELEVEKAFD